MSNCHNATIDTTVWKMKDGTEAIIFYNKCMGKKSWLVKNDQNVCTNGLEDRDKNVIDCFTPYHT